MKNDTDGDGFGDAQEITNLYNPAGLAPARLLDTGLVYEYENPRDGWTISVPRQWAIAAQGSDQRTLVVTTAEGREVLAVFLEEHPSDLTLEVWANQRPDGVALAPLTSFTSKRGAEGVRRAGPGGGVWFDVSDTLAARLMDRFDPPEQYATTVAMIVQSFGVR